MDERVVRVIDDIANGNISMETLCALNELSEVIRPDFPHAVFFSYKAHVLLELSKDDQAHLPQAKECIDRGFHLSKGNLRPCFRPNDIISIFPEDPKLPLHLQLHYMTYSVYTKDWPLLTQIVDEVKESGFFYRTEDDWHRNMVFHLIHSMPPTARCLALACGHACLLHDKVEQLDMLAQLYKRFGHILQSLHRQRDILAFNHERHFVLDYIGALRKSSLNSQECIDHVRPTIRALERREHTEEAVSLLRKSIHLWRRQRPRMQMAQKRRRRATQNAPNVPSDGSNE